jgi:hypothetical protein
MARIEWIETRLRNWARWRLNKGAGVLGFAAVNMQKALSGVREAYADAPVPTNAIEAGETDDAVARLAAPLRKAVEVHYLEQAPGVRQRLATMDDKLRHLCCAKRTYYERIDHAHHALAEHFAAREDKRRAERQRVEGLNALARP